METKLTPLAGLIIITPKKFNDNRGYFYEAYQQERYLELGIPNFVQDNVSRSRKHVLRGMHYQQPNSQGKLVSVTHGSVWDVVVDIRQSSPTFGKWYGITLSAENALQMYIPEGFAHGFCVLSDEADFHYKCTGLYSPSDEQGINWQDQDINIEWPIEKPLLNGRDNSYPNLRDIDDAKLFT